MHDQPCDAETICVSQCTTPHLMRYTYCNKANSELHNQWGDLDDSGCSGCSYHTSNNCPNGGCYNEEIPCRCNYYDYEENACCPSEDYFQINPDVCKNCYHSNIPFSKSSNRCNCPNCSTNWSDESDCVSETNPETYCHSQTCPSKNCYIVNRENTELYDPVSYSHECRGSQNCGPCQIISSCSLHNQCCHPNSCGCTKRRNNKTVSFCNNEGCSKKFQGRNNSSCGRCKFDDDSNLKQMVCDGNLHHIAGIAWITKSCTDNTSTVNFKLELEKPDKEIDSICNNGSFSYNSNSNTCRTEPSHYLSQQRDTYLSVTCSGGLEPSHLSEQRSSRSLRDQHLSKSTCHCSARSNRDRYSSAICSGRSEHSHISFQETSEPSNLSSQQISKSGRPKCLSEESSDQSETSYSSLQASSNSEIDGVGLPTRDSFGFEPDTRLVERDNTKNLLLYGNKPAICDGSVQTSTSDEVHQPSLNEYNSAKQSTDTFTSCKENVSILPDDESSCIFKPYNICETNSVKTSQPCLSKNTSLEKCFVPSTQTCAHHLTKFFPKKVCIGEFSQRNDASTSKGSCRCSNASLLLNNKPCHLHSSANKMNLHTYALDKAAKTNNCSCCFEQSSIMTQETNAACRKKLRKRCRNDDFNNVTSTYMSGSFRSGAPPCYEPIASEQVSKSNETIYHCGYPKSSYSRSQRSDKFSVSNKSPRSEKTYALSRTPTMTETCSASWNTPIIEEPDSVCSITGKYSKSSNTSTRSEFSTSVKSPEVSGNFPASWNPPEIEDYFVSTSKSRKSEKYSTTSKRPTRSEFSASIKTPEVIEDSANTSKFQRSEIYSTTSNTPTRAESSTSYKTPEVSENFPPTWKSPEIEEEDFASTRKSRKTEKYSATSKTPTGAEFSAFNITPELSRNFPATWKSPTTENTNRSKSRSGKYTVSKKSPKSDKFTEKSWSEKNFKCSKTSDEYLGSMIYSEIADDESACLNTLRGSENGLVYGHSSSKTRASEKTSASGKCTTIGDQVSASMRSIKRSISLKLPTIAEENSVCMPLEVYSNSSKLLITVGENSSFTNLTPRPEDTISMSSAANKKEKEENSCHCPPTRPEKSLCAGPEDSLCIGPEKYSLSMSPPALGDVKCLSTKILTKSENYLISMKASRRPVGDCVCTKTYLTSEKYSTLKKSLSKSEKLCSRSTIKSKSLKGCKISSSRPGVCFKSSLKSKSKCSGSRKLKHCESSSGTESSSLEIVKIPSVPYCRKQANRSTIEAEVECERCKRVLPICFLRDRIQENSTILCCWRLCKRPEIMFLLMLMVFYCIFQSF